MRLADPHTLIAERDPCQLLEGRSDLVTLLEELGWIMPARREPIHSAGKGLQGPSIARGIGGPPFRGGLQPVP